jgi:hypothetical protein
VTRRAIHRPRRPDQEGRADLIGACDVLVPANPPKAAIGARRRLANQLAQGDDDIDPIANKAKRKSSGERGARPVKPNGHRPGRKTQKRRQRRK